MSSKSLIIIVTYNSSQFIEGCLESIASQTYTDWKLLVLDNDSSDDTVKRIRDFRNQSTAFDGNNFRLICLKRNMGFSGAINYAVFNRLKETGEKEDFKYLVLLNPDISLFADALQNLTATFDPAVKGGGPDVGAAGGLILEYEEDKIQHMGGKITPNFITYHEGAGEKYNGASPGQGGPVLESDYVTGAFFVTPFYLFCDAGGFDSGYRPVYFEELDYCLKLKEAGWRIASNLRAVCRHFEGASVKRFSTRFYRNYHKNRLRCAVLNIDFPDLMRIFIPAEFKWLIKGATRDQVPALFYAYLMNTIFMMYNLAVKIKNHFILNRIELK
jgi:GT2 family glycosyltransferase